MVSCHQICNIHIHAAIALLGYSTDMNEARSLVFGNSTVDIYSNSWGPPDSGGLVDGPGELARLALKSGANNVRV